MKRTIAILLVVVFVFGCLAGCGNNQSEQSSTPTVNDNPKDVETVELSFSIHDSATSIKGVMYQEWCDQVNAASNGTLNVTLYPGGVLASGSNGLDAMEAGSCDIIWFYTSYYPTLFNLTDIVSLPMLDFDGAGEATNFLWDLYEASPDMAAQYKDYKVIHMYTNPVSYIHSAKKEITCLADLNGMNVAKSGGGTMQAFIAALGCNAMSVDSSDFYESLEKGIIDGQISNGSAMNTWNLSEVTKYFVDMPIYVGTWLCLMDLEKYEALPDDAKAAIDAYSGRENSVYFGTAAQDESNEAYDEAVSSGKCQWITLSDEAIAEFHAIAEPFYQDWVVNNTTDNFDAQEYFDLAMSLMK